MATRYISVDEVRGACGIKTKFINDYDFTVLIERMEYSLENFLNTSFTPKTVMERLQGNGTERIMLKFKPVVKLRDLNIDGTTVDLDAVRLDKDSGIVWLTSDAEETRFKTKSTEQMLIRLKYDYCYLEPTTTQTEIATATTAGSSVNIEVDSSTGFTYDALHDKYIEIEGFDSKIEIAKITAVPDSTHITVDKLTMDHAVDSLITLQQVPPIVKRMMVVWTAMGAVARVVGQSFDEVTGYTLSKEGESEQVQKGEPYTQWREVNVQLRNEWNDLLKRFRPIPSVL